MKNNTTTRGTPAYQAWVKSVHDVMSYMRHAAVKLYEEIKRGKDQKLWKQGPWRTFEECIEQEYSMSSVRWSRLEESIKRFGPKFINDFGYDTTIQILRLPKDSDAERQVIQEVEKMRENAGRPPASRTVAHVVDQAIGKFPAIHPTKEKQSEAQIWRNRTGVFEAQVNELKAALVAEKDSHKNTRRLLEVAEKKLLGVAGSGMS
jgi:hypothetical protein